MRSWLCSLSWLLSFFVLCFKQKTAYELRISDWSSDVCSSDLGGNSQIIAGVNSHRRHAVDQRQRDPPVLAEQWTQVDALLHSGRCRGTALRRHEQDRKSVV